MEIVIQIMVGIVISVTAAILVSRYTRHMTDSKKRDKTVFKCLLALLICQRDGKCNGELKEALEDLNDYLFEK